MNRLERSKFDILIHTWKKHMWIINYKISKDQLDVKLSNSLKKWKIVYDNSEIRGKGKIDSRIESLFANL